MWKTKLIICRFLSLRWIIAYHALLYRNHLSVLSKKQSSSILDYELLARSWCWFLGSQSTGDISHKPGDRLPLFSTRFSVTFPAKEITLLGQYQIMLPGDRDTQVQVACPRPLRNGTQPIQPGLEPATCESQFHCPANSTTANDYTNIHLSPMSIVYWWPKGGESLQQGM